MNNILGRIGIFLCISLFLNLTHIAAQEKHFESYHRNSVEDIDDFNVIFQQDLDDTPLGVYSNSRFAEDWNDPPWANGIYDEGDRTVIIDYNKGGRKSRGMEWKFPKGTFSATRAHGYQWHTDLGGSYEECYLSYSIMFKPGFEPVLGGKIPGFQGGPKDSGPPEYEDGFGGSLMFKQGPKPVFYCYHQDQAGTHGDTRGWDYIFDVETDIWYDITYRIVMNTPTSSDGGEGERDGILEGWVNGELVGQWSGLRLRNLANIGVDILRVQGFFGGGSDWATTRDEWMLLDNFYVWTYTDEYLAEHSEVKRGRQLNSWRSNIYTPLDAGQVDDSIPDPDVDTQAPLVPTGLHVVDSSETSISLAWDETSDNVGVVGYKVHIGNLVKGSTGQTNYKFTSLEPGTRYAISVSAFDAKDNESAKSSIVYGKTSSPDTIPPSVPSGFTATNITGYSIEYSWEPSSDNFGVTGYKVYMNDAWMSDQPSTSFVASGLSPNTNYSIRVQAFDEAGNLSSLSTAFERRTGGPDTIPPSAPENLRVTNFTETTISLKWDASTDNISVREYIVHVNNEENERSSLTEETIARLEPGLEYEISVSAIDEAHNESSRSEPIVIATKNEDVITNPTLPTVSILDVQDNSAYPKTIAELTSLGFIELRGFGIDIVEADLQGQEHLILKGLSNSTVFNQNRVSKGLQVLYNFADGQGDRVSDVSGVGSPLDLKIKNEGLATEWLVGQGLRVFGNTSISSVEKPAKIFDSLVESNEVTIEAWVKQEEIDQSGPARIIALSGGTEDCGITLGHKGNSDLYNYLVRLNTTSTGKDGLPQLETSQDFSSTSLHHVVYTRDGQGIEKLYVNGFELSSGIRAGSFSSWNDSIIFTLANECTKNHPWSGIFYLVAVYNRALNMSEVEQNYDSGIGQIRYSTELDTLATNVEYILTPYASTNHGIVFGDPENFIFQDYATADDNLLNIYPNPSRGDLTVKIDIRDESLGTVRLRVIDFAGHIHYTQEFYSSDELGEKVYNIQLPGSMKNGIYALVHITGSKSVAERFVLLK